MVRFLLSFQINLSDKNNPVVSHLAKLFSPEAPKREIKRFLYLDPVANVALETLFFNSKDIFTTIAQERREYAYHLVAVAAPTPPPAALSPAHPARCAATLCEPAGPRLHSKSRPSPPSTFSWKGSHSPARSGQSWHQLSVIPQVPWLVVLYQAVMLSQPDVHPPLLSPRLWEGVTWATRRGKGSAQREGSE